MISLDKINIRWKEVINNDLNNNIIINIYLCVEYFLKVQIKLMKPAKSWIILNKEDLNEFKINTN